MEFPAWDFRHGEWLFPAVLPADLDLELIKLADQFVLTYQAKDIHPRYTGSLPPATGDLGLGLRLGFGQLQHPNALFEAPKRSDGQHHTRPVHAHATCGSAPPPTTVRTCLDRGALLPGVVIPSRVLLAAARRYRPKAQKLHRARVDTGLFDRAPCTATPVPFRGEAGTAGPLWMLPRDSPPRIASSMHVAPRPPTATGKKARAAPVRTH
jgi:hypothetical protein